MSENLLRDVEEKMEEGSNGGVILHLTAAQWLAVYDRLSRFES